MRQTAITCDGCGESASADFASSTLPTGWLNVDISIVADGNKLLDRRFELCAECCDRVTTQADPTRWPRGVIVHDVKF